MRKPKNQPQRTPVYRFIKPTRPQSSIHLLSKRQRIWYLDKSSNAREISIRSFSSPKKVNLRKGKYKSFTAAKIKSRYRIDNTILRGDGKSSFQTKVCEFLNLKNSPTPETFEEHYADKCGRNNCNHAPKATWDIVRDMMKGFQGHFKKKALKQFKNPKGIIGTDDHANGDTVQQPRSVQSRS